MTLSRTAMLMCAVSFFSTACGDDPLDPGGESDGKVAVSLTVVPDSMGPGDWADIRLVATPEDPSEQISSLRLTVRGIVHDAATVDVQRPGMIDVTFHYDVPRGPYAGAVVFMATAQLGEHSATAEDTLIVRDVVAPFTSVFPGEYEPGGQMYVGIHAEDNGAVVGTAIEVSGGFDYAADSTNSYLELDANHHYTIPVPASTVLGDSLRILAIAVDWVGLADTVEISTVVADDIAPTLEVARVPQQYESRSATEHPVYATGDTLQFTMFGIELNPGGWFHWRIVHSDGGMWKADSVEFTRTADTVDVEIVVQPGWEGMAGLEYAASDAAGNRAEANETVWLFDGMWRPMYESPDLQFIDHSALVYDADRKTLYTTSSSRGKIYAFSSDSMRLLDSLLIGGNPIGNIDVTAAGDTIVFPIQNVTQFGLIDLNVTPRSVEKFELDVHSGFGFPTYIAALQNSWVLLNVSCTYYPDGPGLLAYDLGSANGELHLNVPPCPFIARSGDHSKAFIAGSDQGFFYDAVSAQLGPGTAVPEGFRPKLDRTGALMLWSGTVYDSSMTIVRDLRLLVDLR